MGGARVLEVPYSRLEKLVELVEEWMPGAQEIRYQPYLVLVRPELAERALEALRERGREAGIGRETARKLEEMLSSAGERLEAVRGSPETVLDALERLVTWNEEPLGAAAELSAFSPVLYYPEGGYSPRVLVSRGPGGVEGAARSLAASEGLHPGTLVSGLAVAWEAVRGGDRLDPVLEAAAYVFRHADPASGAADASGHPGIHEVLRRAWAEADRRLAELGFTPASESAAVFARVEWQTDPRLSYKLRVSVVLGSRSYRAPGGGGEGGAAATLSISGEYRVDRSRLPAWSLKAVLLGSSPRHPESVFVSAEATRGYAPRAPWRELAPAVAAAAGEVAAEGVRALRLSEEALSRLEREAGKAGFSVELRRYRAGLHPPLEAPPGRVAAAARFVVKMGKRGLKGFEAEVDLSVRSDGGAEAKVSASYRHTSLILLSSLQRLFQGLAERVQTEAAARTPKAFVSSSYTYMIEEASYVSASLSLRGSLEGVTRAAAELAREAYRLAEETVKSFNESPVSRPPSKNERVLAALIASVLAELHSGSYLSLRFLSGEVPRALRLWGAPLDRSLTKLTGVKVYPGCSALGDAWCYGLHIAALVSKGRMKLEVADGKLRLLVKTDDGRLLSPDDFLVEVLARSGRVTREVTEEVAQELKNTYESMGGAAAALAYAALSALAPPLPEYAPRELYERLSKDIVFAAYRRGGAEGVLAIFTSQPRLLENRGAREAAGELASKIREYAERVGVLRLAERYPPMLLARVLSEILGGGWLAGRLVAEFERAGGRVNRRVLAELVYSTDLGVAVGLAARLGIRPGSGTPLWFLEGLELEPLPRIKPEEEPPSVWPAKVKGVGAVVASVSLGGVPAALFAPREGAPMFVMTASEARALLEDAARRAGGGLVEALYLATLRAALEAGGRIERIPGSSASVVVLGGQKLGIESEEVEVAGELRRVARMKTRFPGFPALRLGSGGRRGAEAANS